MTAALMEGLELGCQLEKTENDVVFQLKACLCFTQLKRQSRENPGGQ